MREISLHRGEFNARDT